MHLIKKTNMKIFKILLVLSVSIFLLSFTISRKIPVKIKFQNLENLNFTEGKLLIKELNKEININKISDFEIHLKPGKYHFKFISETKNIIIYPKKIDAKNNEVQIIFSEKKTLETSMYVDENNFSEMLKSGNAKFIQFGLISGNANTFKEKYGIGVQYENCVITPFLQEKATVNNQILAKYLTEKFGETWKNDLEFLPLGL